MSRAEVATLLSYLLIVLAMAVEAFYSGNETGFYCVNRLRLMVRAEQEGSAARALMRLTQRPQLAISTMLIGTNVGVYTATVLVTNKLRMLGLGQRADLYSSLILPPILLVFAEIMPKSTFQHHADYLMYRTAWPLRISMLLLYPFSVFLRAVSRIPQLLLAERVRPRAPALTRDTFQFYLSESAARGVLSTYQRTMAENILRLRSVRVDATMTPLSEAVMISLEGDRAELTRLFKEHRYSRLPVYRGERDNIVGMVNVLDVASQRGEPAVEDLLREVVELPRETSVADALRQLRRAQQQFAVVTGEAGRAVGIVTVKDLVEEIVGELEAW